jgi:hypothetical protein
MGFRPHPECASDDCGRDKEYDEYYRRAFSLPAGRLFFRLLGFLRFRVGLFGHYLTSKNMLKKLVSIRKTLLISIKSGLGALPEQQ